MTACSRRTRSTLIIDTLNQRLEERLWEKDEKKAGWPHYKCWADKDISRAKRENAKEYRCK